MPQSSKGKIVAAILAVLFLIGAIYAARGYREYARLSEEHAQVVAANAQLEEENRKLKTAIEALKQDDEAVEKVARERLGLIKEDEVIYQLPE